MSENEEAQSEAQEILKRLMAQRVSMRTIATDTGLDVGNLSKVLHGTRNASPEQLSRLRTYETSVQQELQAPAAGQYQPAFHPNTALVQLRTVRTEIEQATQRAQAIEQVKRVCRTYLLRQGFPALWVNMLSVTQLIEYTRSAYARQREIEEDMLTVLETPPPAARPVPAIQSPGHAGFLPQKAATLNRARVRDMRGSQPTRVLMCSVCHWQINAKDWMIATIAGQEYDIHEHCRMKI